MLDNIIVFYILFTIVGFLAAMLGTIIGAGGGLVRSSLHVLVPGVVLIYDCRDIALFRYV